MRFFGKRRVSRSVQVAENRDYRSLFCYIGLSGFSGENGLITSLKNVPYRPFWLANPGLDGPGQENVGEKGKRRILEIPVSENKDYIRRYEREGEEYVIKWGLFGKRSDFGSHRSDLSTKEDE